MNGQGDRRVATVALISGLYDSVAGACLLFAPTHFARLFGLAPVQPPIFSDLNGLFLLAVGAGFALPWRDPARYRGYMWLMGTLLKGAGAAAFVLDYASRASPRSVLLFAASDALVALLALWALTTGRTVRD